MRATRIVGLGVVAASLASQAGTPDRPQYLGPKEIIELLEKSPNQYKIASETAPLEQWSQQNAKLLWPAARQEVAFPTVQVGPDGRKKVTEWHAEAAAQALMNTAEEAFQAGDCEKARQGYDAVLAKFPKHYAAMMGQGDCAAHGRDYELAFKWYSKAAPLLPSDHHNFWYRADCELARGNKAEAIKLYVHALALAPRSEGLRSGLESRQAALGVTLRTDNFLPYARVEREGDAITIKISKGSAKQPVSMTSWLAWGDCKAAWLGEPEHRKAITGSTAITFSSMEETECLGNLAISYDLNEKDKGADDVARFVDQVWKAKMLPEMLIFEIASRVDPHIVLTLPDDELPKLENYVRKFVLVPVPK
ncbi:MAG: tetratricopeptide repeat protein [Myxococcaceae bacterium]